MFSQLASHERLAPLLPYVRQFYGQASQYLWCDDNGAAHVVEQGEGGEQGDPLLLLGEVLFAFLNDIYILSRPGRARPIFDILQARLQAHAGIQVNLGKTRAWNAGGVLPLPHLQSAWLILLLCGAPRANYLLRILPPCHTHAIAREHDAAVLRCLGRLLSAEEPLELDALQRRRDYPWRGAGWACGLPREVCCLLGILG